MLKIYGKEKTDAEVIEFVKNHAESVKKAPHDRYHAIMSLVPNGGKRILDYGCGWGHLSVAMRNKGNIVYAIDLSENEIDICKLVWGEEENLKFEKRSIFSFEDESFDCVLSSHVIEHVHNPGRYLSEINRVLKKDGQLIIALPNVANPRFLLGLLRNSLEKNLRELSERMLRAYKKGHDHINAWEPTHFVTLASSTGFLMERYLPAEGVPFPFTKFWKSPYINRAPAPLRNMSYTMVFSFRKVRYVKINPED